MFQQIIPAIRATIVLAALTGLAFPVAVTGLAQLLFKNESNGSLLFDSNGHVVGSRLIGQAFSKPEYFHGRPSAAGSGYSGEASSGTNLGPCSSKLIQGSPDDPATKETDESYSGIKQLSESYRKDNLLKENEKPPVDAVTRSASGLDPDVSIMNAEFQARRVAAKRNLPVAKVLKLINDRKEPRQFGILGEPRVNVLVLNTALDELDREKK